MNSPPIPIFIVGAPRSGTTLLAAMFGAHPDYAAGPETQFFIKISPRDLQAAGHDPRWPRLALKRIQQLSTAGQSALDLFETDLHRVEAFLSKRQASIHAMLESLVVPFAASRGKAGWVEKTPNHMEKLPEIRAAFPDARIIRIVRDPRDVAVSTSKLPAFSNSIIANAYLWREWFDQSEEVFATDPHCATLRYEDLVQNPHKELESVCEKLGLQFHPAMLEYQQVAADVSSAAEPWKAQVASKLDPSRSFSWRNTLDRETANLVGMVCYEWIERFGYDSAPRPRRTLNVYTMSAGFVEKFEPMLRAEAAQMTRWLGTFDLRRADLVVDHPRYYRFGNPLKLARLAWGRNVARRKLKQTNTAPDQKVSASALATSHNPEEPS